MPQIEKDNLAGLEYWRSLEQLADAPEVRQAIEKEFPNYNPDEIRGLSRRRLLRFMGASLALAGLTLSGCRRWPKEKIAPYTGANPNRIPGVPEQYATVMELGGVGHGLLVTSYDGRPIKIEGNPSHPFARTETGATGAADAFAQASVLELYDPDRSRVVVDRRGTEPRPSTWETFVERAKAHLGELRTSGAGGLAVLCEATSSPSVLDMKQRLQSAIAGCKWYEYEPISHDTELAGTKAALGKPARPRLHLEKARTIVCLDADLLGTHPAHVRYACDWAKGRRSADTGAMNRVYIAESCFSITGSVADRRLPIRPSRVALIAGAIAAGVGLAGAAQAELTGDERAFVDAAVTDLKKGDAVVAAGGHLSAELHSLVVAINQAVGAIGKTIEYVEDACGMRPSHLEAMKELTQAINGGQVTTLLILGGNPAYDAPADVDFAGAVAKLRHTAHLSLYENETSRACRWHLPRAHYLESWGDARAWDGTISIQQPLIEPLFGGKSAIELLAMLLGDDVTDGEKIVRRTHGPKASDEKAWRRALHDGVAGWASPTAASVAGVVGGAPSTGGTPASGFEVRFLQDSSTYDGRFANSGWLQEMPDPLTKLTWDNAAMLSKHDADALGVKTGDMVRVAVGARSLEIAAYVLPGQPLGVIGLPLGYGRKSAGNVGNGVGFNAYVLRTSDAMGWAAGASVTKLGAKYALAMTQDHHIIDELGMKARQKRVGEKGHSGKIIRQASIEEYARDPHFVKHGDHGDVTLQLFDPPARLDNPHAWGMAVDLSSCIGCNACAVACQAENNIPVVGKDQVAMNREMQWIRIDRYFKGSADDSTPEVVHQPMMCQHCENAPCEQVCPVAATVHDTEGLNVMVYNRCIGTRYCANNCPYKVRRFNYLDFHSKDPRGSAKPWLGMPDSQQESQIDQIKRMVFNPEVSVRMRGVMEKCTYCVQRIKSAEQGRRNKGEDVRDGDVVTACQQACPTDAIVFGDLKDPTSHVSRLHKNNRAYAVLAELNVRPRTAYLAKITNSGPSAAAPKHEGGHG